MSISSMILCLNNLTACVPQKYGEMQQFLGASYSFRISSLAFIISPRFVISSAEQKMAVILVRFCFAHSYSCEGFWI